MLLPNLQVITHQRRHQLKLKVLLPVGPGAVPWIQSTRECCGCAGMAGKGLRTGKTGHDS